METSSSYDITSQGTSKLKVPSDSSSDHLQPHLKEPKFHSRSKSKVENNGSHDELSIYIQERKMLNQYAKEMKAEV